METQEAEVEKRFEALDNDYLSIPDAEDFSFPDRDIVLAIEFDNTENHGVVKVLKDQQQLEDYLRS